MGSALSRIKVPSSAEAYDAALEGLTGLDEVILRQHPEMPPLYDSGAKYKARRHDVWRHADDVCGERDEQGDLWGDCEDLACYRAAELRITGEDPRAHVRTYKTGAHKYHCVVQRGTGIIEDPSRVLGMKIGDPDGYRRRIAMNFGDDAQGETVDGGRGMGSRDGADVYIGEDPTPDHKTLSFDIYHTGNGWSGVFRIPTNNGQAMFLKSSASATKPQAAAKATNLLKLAAGNPVLQSLIPPQAAMALKLVNSPVGQGALKAAGKLRKLFG